MADDREALGRLVHDIRLACEAERAAAEGRQRFLLPPWEDRDDWQRELDMRIGAAVAAAERERAERAEAALAAIRKRCRIEQGSWIRIPAILAIAGDGEGEVR